MLFLGYKPPLTDKISMFPQLPRLLWIFIPVTPLKPLCNGLSNFNDVAFDLFDQSKSPPCSSFKLPETVCRSRNESKKFPKMISLPLCDAKLTLTEFDHTVFLERKPKSKFRWQ